MWDYIIMFILTILAYLFAHLQFKKMGELAKKNKKHSKNYGNNIITGIASGIIVIALDRGLTTIITHAPAINTRSGYSLLTSAIQGILLILFEVSFLLGLIFYIINQGLKKK